MHKLSLMSGRWNRLALCWLVERLAAGIAYYNIKDELTYEVLSVGPDVHFVGSVSPGNLLQPL